MAKETIANNFGQGGAKLSEQGPGGLKAILKELQGLNITGSAGALAGADITVTGMTAEDTVLAVVDITTAATPANLDITKFVPKAGGKLTSTDATNAKGLLIYWLKKS